MRIRRMRSAAVAVLVLLAVGCAGDVSDPEPVTSAELLGRVRAAEAPVVVVNFWATWCTPCREEFPAYVRFADDYRAKNVKLIFVSVDSADKRAEVRSFLREQDVTSRTYLREEDIGSFVRGVHRDWSGGIPATFIYDKAGELRIFWEGKGSYGRLKRNVTELLGENP